ALPSVILVKAPQLPGDVETLQAAVDAASDGDTILLKKGTYHENIVINKSVTLIGFGPGSTIISGDTGAEIIKGGVINITKPLLQSSGPNVTLVGMTIMQGTAQYGGGIFNSEGTLTLSGVSITNSTASFSGGGIYNQMGTVVMNGSMVAENTAKVGAGVMNDGGTFVLNEGSSISGNSAQIAGGLDNLAGTVIMNDGSSLTNNSATYDGGGMYSYFYSTITLNGGTITSNTAETGTGGGIYSDSDSIVNLFGGDVSGNIPNDIYYFT
ncbi:MAG TPA: pectinesterase family protein, partial [Methanoregulaceae archaeon]|nr:pectinesterase family protein [Methanoregulaceae archaeon]